MALIVGKKPFEEVPDRSPKYAIVKGALLQRIQADALPPGAFLPSEQSLAKEFRVSNITIRRALNDLTRDGILQRKPGVGTFVATGEEAVPTKSTILFLSCNQSPEEYSKFLAGVDQILSTHEHPLLYSSLGAFSDEEGDRLRRLIHSQSVGGLLITGLVNDEVVRFVKAFGLPVLLVGNYPLLETISQVAIDTLSLARRIVDLFLRAGLRRIGLMNGRRRYGLAVDLFHSFRLAVEDHSREVEVFKVAWDEDAGQVDEQALQLLRDLGHPAGLFVEGDTMGAALHAVARLNLSVPQDIQLIGYEDPCLRNYKGPTLARIAPDWTKFPDVVYQALMQLMEKDIPCTVKYFLETIYFPGESLTVDLKGDTTTINGNVSTGAREPRPGKGVG